MSRSKLSVKKRILASTMAVAVAASVIGTAVYIDSNKAHAARVTLRGIQELANAHSEGSDEGRNPFIIYEVVNNYADAKLGYLIGGEEPVAIEADRVKSIKDMPSSDERAAELPPTFDPSGRPLYDDAYSWTSYDESGDSRSMDIRGIFEEKTGVGDYDEAGATSGTVPYAGSLYDTTNTGVVDEDELNAAGGVNADNVILGRKVSIYTLGDVTEITKINDDSDIPVNDGTLGGDGEAWNYQYFTIASTIDSFESIPDDTTSVFMNTGSPKIYKGTISASYDSGNKKRTITDGGGNTLELQYDDDGNITGSTLTGSAILGVMSDKDYQWDVGPMYTITETNNSGDNLYRISAVSGSGSVSIRQINGTPSSYTISDVPDTLGPYYICDATRSGYIYNSGGTGDYVFKADYSRQTYETFTYDGGFDNNEWFKTYVFDRTTPEEYENLSIDVVTVKAEDLTLDMLSKAGLIYFNYYTGSGADSVLDEDVGKAIVANVADNKLSVMMEYATYTEAADGSNLKGMALALMKNTVTAIPDGDALGSVSTDDLWFGADNPTTTDISYVNGTVFINDNKVAGSSNIVASDFYTPAYTSAKVSYGFADVDAENKAEKSYLELQPNIDASEFNMDISKATSIRYILNKNTNRIVVKSKLKILDIEPYDTSQYTQILVGDTANNDTEDSPLRELRVNGQVINSVTRYENRDILTKSWVTNNLEFTGSEDDIDIRQIGTKEFVGINDDLNTEYDLIYIGMDKAMLNTELDQNNTRKTDGETKYNKTSMNGLVYSHIGDTFDKYDDGKYGSALTVVAAGNDITPNKVRELKNYIMAGYAVVISDGFYDADGNLNKTTVDESSRMYDLMNWLFNGDGRKYLDKNVMRKSNLEPTNSAASTYRGIFSNFLNVSKLELDVQSIPKKYENTDSSYLDIDSDGLVWLKFKIGLTNNSAVDTSEQTTYDCKLYIDMDADGNYEKVEALDGVVIDGESESDGHFSLKAGKTYNISRVVPEGYVGFLPWKIEFVQNGKAGDTFSSDAVRRSVIGYSAVRLIGDKPTINVLQIVSGDKNPKGDTDESGYTLNLNDEVMNNLYDQVNDFKVKIYQTNASDYIMKRNLPTLEEGTAFSGTYFEFLSQFDIVAMGFADVYAFTSSDVENSSTDNAAKGAVIDGQWHSKDDIYTDAALGIREYALSGRSMLFTHDLSHSGLIENPTRYDNRIVPGFYLTKYLRDVMGMDRYGYTEGTDYTYRFDRPGHTVKEYEVKTDTNKLKGSSVDEKLGYTDANILYRTKELNGTGNNMNAYYGDVWRSRNNLSIVAKNAGDAYEHSSYQPETVTAINRGQITQYPFVMPDEPIEVERTHSQYFQLNLDTDDTDELYDDDIVVWYTLSNTDADKNSEFDHRFYRAMQKDARNNYYIYTKGNITYTGAGHRLIKEDKLDERKLFVNTLVAAYSSGSHSPKVVYKEHAAEKAANITCTYVPYDPELEGSTPGDAGTDGGFLDSKLIVNFKTLNSNIRSYSTGLKAAYYMPVASGGDITIGNKQYKAITPTSLKVVNESTGALEPVTDYNNLLNFRIYQAEFDLGQFSMGSTGTTLSRDSAALYIRLGMDEFETIENGTLPGTESMTGLDIYATRLFNLE